MRCAECARVSWALCHAFDLVISMSLSRPYQAAMLAVPSSAVWKQIFHCVWALTFRASYAAPLLRKSPEASLIGGLSAPPPFALQPSPYSEAVTLWLRDSWLGKRRGRAFE